MFAFLCINQDFYQVKSPFSTYLDGKNMDIESSKSQSDEARKIRALIVDDDPTVRKIHGMLLRKHGLEIEAVENGKEAVQLFMAGKSFDLVLMDLEMPIMDGLKATEELRAMGVNAMIVGVTACSVEAEKEAFMAAGLDYCWQKPLNGGAVISTLDELAKKLL